MTREIKPNEFRCDRCLQIFKKGWSDEEAMAELKKNFGQSDPSNDPADCAIICDDCYNDIMSEIRASN